MDNALSKVDSALDKIDSALEISPCKKFLLVRLGSWNSALNLM